jgi:hypothetical protein
MATVIAIQKKKSDETPSPGSQSSNELNTKSLAEVNISETSLPLGVPGEERRFWFQRAKAYDPNAIATQVGFPWVSLNAVYLICQ